MALTRKASKVRNASKAKEQISQNPLNAPWAYSAAIVETIHEPLVVLDRSLRIVTANAAFHEMFPSERADTSRQSFFEIGDRQWDIPALKRLLRKVLPKNDRVVDFQVDYRYPGNGRRRLLLNAKRVPSDGIRLESILIAINDVTSSLDAIDELKSSEQHLRLIAENSSDLITISDTNGRFSYVSPSSLPMLGYRPEELLGVNGYEIIHPEDRELVRRELHEPFLREQRLRRGVFRLIRKTGGFIWIDTIARPVFDKDGVLSAMQGAGRDITAAKLAEKELIRSRSEHQALNERLINELEEERRYLSREIHDGFSQEIAALIIETERFVSASTGENRQKARTMVTQLRKLAEDMHRVARRLHPSILTDLGLPAALRAACNAFANQTGISVTFKLRSVPETIPEKIALCLYRVAEEALHNIRKHALASAEVKVLLSATSSQLVMTIKDIGDGFDLAKVRSKGGLGLVSMEERVRLIHGILSIESAPQKGTVVMVRVPIG
jgi:PAS domain S-box-containing protein